MPSRVEWVVEIDMVGQLVEHPKEGWVRILVSRDVAKELHADLGHMLEIPKPPTKPMTQ